MAFATVKIRDFSDEYSSFSVPIGDYESLDTISTVETINGNLETYINSLSLGTIVSVTFSQATQENADTRPASGAAQREVGFRVFYHEEATNRKGSFTIPAADTETYAVAGKDELDLTQAEVALLVGWVEANTEIGGQPVVVDRIVIVGRSN